MKIQKKKKWLTTGRALTIAAIVIVLGAAGYIAYQMYYHPSTPPPSSPQTPASSSAPSSQPTNSTLPTTSQSDDNSTAPYTTLSENEEYKIEQQKGTSNYRITLYPIVNNAQQYSTYQDQLREYKQHALDYLSKNGVNVSKINVTYDPKEAAQL